MVSRFPPYRLRHEAQGSEAPAAPRAGKESQCFLPLGRLRSCGREFPRWGRCFYPLGAKGSPLFLAPERPLKSAGKQENQSYCQSFFFLNNPLTPIRSSPHPSDERQGRAYQRSRSLKCHTARRPVQAAPSLPSLLMWRWSLPLGASSPRPGEPLWYAEYDILDLILILINHPES